MASDTREQFLDTAEALFAERGFYGVSIAAIAEELGLTKQALLHHFGSKERLYGAVLQRISDDFERTLSDAASAEKDPAKRFKSYLLTLASGTLGDAARSQLLMRELLDNKHRAEGASTWYLKSYLETLTAMVRAAPGWERSTEAEAFALVYQLLGALNYFAISQPTLTGIFGKSRARSVRNTFPDQLEALIDAAMSNR